MSFVELCTKTHYSFLRGASSPQELVERAYELGYRSLGIADLNGVYGLPKAYLASKDLNFKLIVGAEIAVRDHASITVWATHRRGYGHLCRLITAAHADKPKGEAHLNWEELLQFLEARAAQDWRMLLSLGDLKNTQNLWNYHTLKDRMNDRIFVPVSRFFDGRDEERIAYAQELKRKFGIRLLATNDVHFHIPERKRLQDVVTAIRETVSLKEAGFKFFSNHERYLKSPPEMEKIFFDLPEAIENSAEIANDCIFSLSELRYRYPSEWIPTGYTAQAYLAELVWKGARWRYHENIPTDVESQLRHELKLIEELKFEDYFLTIWEIVEFAKARGILCQGRGAAANSAVCYCLGITAVDPVRMKLLFERFISAERGEPPDIDVDFEHERREEVIQHIYQKYGRDRAGMVAAVITYRSRSAIRQITKVFGEELDRRDFLKKCETSPTRETDVIQEMIHELKGFPRHLSIHSGGFTLSADPMIEIVPIEPARMEDRTIVQWDKYDLDILGLLKVDILSLGMLTALKKTMDLVGEGISLAKIPAEDPKTYEMIRAADTVGTFQIESRAQMSMLPRLLPENFYDLVVQISLVRPGPIVGNMVHPYLKRRRGLEPVDIPHPKLVPILERTLGVPLFQEQVMKMAIHLAGFKPGEADELRRAIGAWRSSGSIEKIGIKLMNGLLANGISQDYANLVFKQMQGFAHYGFPESHAASFALLAYASCYLKCHYPAEFTCGLLNSQPLGFYAPHTLVDDARLHGVKVLPLDLDLSEWDCTIERGGGGAEKNCNEKALRLGFRYLRGMTEAEGRQIIKLRAESRFSGLKNFLDRVSLRRPVLHRLALGDVFRCFGFDQRHALWAVLAHDRLMGVRNVSGGGVDGGRLTHQLSLFSYIKDVYSERANLFKTLDSYEAICSDYSVYRLSTRGHPMQEIRKRLPQLPRMTNAQARKLSHDQWVKVPGLSVVMQRPPTAKGTVFATLEDETGFLDLVLHKVIFEKYKEMIWDECFLIVYGKIQRDGNSVSLIVKKVMPFPRPPTETKDEPISLMIPPSLSEGVRWG